MANHQFRLQSSLNVSFDHVVDSTVSEEEWAEMSEAERKAEMADALWEHVDVSDEENR
jgi:hypothetical protein